MDTPNALPLTDADIHRLLDGEVHGAERDSLLQRLQGDPHGRERMAQWQAQKDAIRQLHAGVLHEPLPPALLDVVNRGGDAQTRLTHRQWPSDSDTGARHLATLPAFAHDAAVAHAVYTPEKRHPVEVGAIDQEHLVQWLSRRTGKPLKVPRLDALGYELVGGRLLPGDAGARAQFMFQNAEGARVTLYLGALVPITGESAPSGETAFRFSEEGPVPGFYWVDQGFGYALSGALSREALMALAEAVYRQL